MRAALATMLLVTGCNLHAAECRERSCPRFGVDEATCERLCTGSCDGIARDFGMSRDTCEALQRGESR